MHLEQLSMKSHCTNPLILHKSSVILYFLAQNSIQIKSITRIYTQLFMYITVETGMDDKEYLVYLANRRLKLAPVIWHVVSPQESLKGEGGLWKG